MTTDTPIHSLWNMASRWVSANADTQVYAPFPSESPNGDVDAPLKAYGSYFRVWLSEMFLTQRVARGAQYFPAVHSEVKLSFGDQGEVVFSHVAQPPQGNLAEGILLNYRLTDLLPYNAGVVEIQASLLGLKGEDYLATAINVLQSFSSLVAAPLGQAMTLAGKVSTGAHDLLQASNGRIHLVFHQSFTSEGGKGTVLRPGYHAVILATPGQVAIERLSVVDGRLHYKKDPRAAAEPLRGYDFMLFRIEGRAERDDWRLSNIDGPLRQAITAYSQNKPDEGAAYRTLALATVYNSPDLAPLDRRRVVEAIKEELKPFEDGGHGAVGDEPPSLDTLMKQRAISLSEAAVLGAVRPDEIFARA
jgi:hypothetical protein